jgi:hypothetical protein
MQELYNQQLGRAEGGYFDDVELLLIKANLLNKHKVEHKTSTSPNNSVVGNDWRMELKVPAST